MPSRPPSAQVLEVVNRPPFADLLPKQIVPRLADQGEYMASESSRYRILREEQQLTHRGKARPATHRRPEPWVATGPHPVWTWDITYLPTPVRGVFFYLYLILDLFSRKIVGWEVHSPESAEHAAVLFRQSYRREGVDGAARVLHSDNGAPMKGATMLATLQRLGVMPSFSRSSVSHDNPFSESLFRTLKYTPAYPEGPFASLNGARAWVARFLSWYNGEHRHSAIRARRATCCATAGRCMRLPRPREALGFARLSPNLPITPIIEVEHAHATGKWVLRQAYSPNGSLLAISSHDYTAKLWRIDQGPDGPRLTLLHTLDRHTDSVHAVAFSPDGYR